MAKAKSKPEAAAPAGPPGALLDALIGENPVGRYGSTYGLKLEGSVTGKAMLALDRDAQAVLVEEAVNRLVALDRRTEEIRQANGYRYQVNPEWTSAWNQRCLCEVALRGLLKRKLPLTGEQLAALVEWPIDAGSFSAMFFPLASLASAAENYLEVTTPNERLTAAFRGLAAFLRKYENDADCRKAADRFAKMLTEGPVVRLEPGEAWSDAAVAELAAMDPETRARWQALLAHAQSATGTKPTAAWLNGAKPKVEAVGVPEFKARLLKWFPLVDRPRTQEKVREHVWEPSYDDLILAPHVDLLKGLVWCAGERPDRDLARALTNLAVSAYRKVPGKGPRLVTLGNACVAALGMMPGAEAVGSLALLKVKVKFGNAQKEVEKALTAAALREGLPRGEIEELAVPAYGMDGVGRRREVLGDYVGELVVDGSDTELRWSKADGKALKSVPAAVKADHGDDLKELQDAAKDAARMLAAQRERIDGLYLARKTWPYATWRERYVDHPLVGTIARRLIWTFTTGGKVTTAFGPDGRLVSLDGRPLDPSGDTVVSLWHPIESTTDDVLAWRARLEDAGVRQPFKQAHREVYVLTDAERNTRVYSNRFAAHVVRQHQFHALAAARGWKNRLRLLVDDTYPPATRDLPEWGLRAEYWIEGIGDDYGTDTNESGAYLYLATDQVRFYPIAARQNQAHAGGGGYGPQWNTTPDEPVPLELVPPLVLSEILRDVDLFVGVGSVGNDPNWSDGGPNGRHVDYWQSFSFGDLSATAKTRKAVLERLVPRLKIAPRCSFSDKFLVVRGDLRTYKIHLGSGNILMEPNDQYLCIVPKRGGAAGATDGVFLPFEGDATLSVVLSKALMLADDTRITDTTITSQIGTTRG